MYPVQQGDLFAAVCDEKNCKLDADQASLSLALLEDEDSQLSQQLYNRTEVDQAENS